MRDALSLSGVVLEARPVGEYDRRLVLLTRERGRITAFARGARRTKSPLLAATNPFVFAVFTLYEGRDAYTLVQADVKDYFTSLASAIPGVFYGFYFLELAGWYTREGLEAGEIVNLLFVSLRALVRDLLPVEMIRSIFELRMLSENGEYSPALDASIEDPYVRNALAYAASAPPGRLYGFVLTEEQQRLFRSVVKKHFAASCDKSFKTLAVIDEMK